LTLHSPQAAAAAALSFCRSEMANDFQNLLAIEKISM
jgi:hypothetical protein